MASAAELRYCQILAAVVAASLGPAAQAGFSLHTWASHTWPGESSDGRFIYVQIAPTSIEEESKIIMESGYEVDRRTKEMERIRLTYPTSGLYRADDVREPLWALSDPMTSSQVHIVDGRHVWVAGDWVWDSMKTEVATLYEDGATKKTILDSDLFGRYWIRRKFARRIPECNSFELDPSGTRLLIGTDMGDEVSIDARTGQIVQSNIESITMQAFLGSRTGVVLILLFVGGISLTLWLLKTLVSRLRGAEPRSSR